MLVLAANLRLQGTDPGERVILWGSNSPQWVTAFFATLKNGSIAVPFDTRANLEFLDKVIETTRPGVIIAGHSQLRDLPAKYGIPVIEMERISMNHSGAPEHDTQAFPDNPAEIVFTSGTTGRPKGVVLTHRNILSNIDSVRQIISLSVQNRLLSTLPLSHMFEMTAGLLVPMAEGASVIYLDTLKPANLLKAMREEKITCMAVAPRVLQIFKEGIEKEITKAGKKRQWDLLNRLSPYLPMSMRRIVSGSLHQKMGGHFDFFVCGGAALDPNLAGAWENLGIKVIQGYGMTEASPVVSCDSMYDRNHKFVGKPIPGVEVKIAPDGEILVRDPNIMAGYWNNPEATAEALEDSWYRTGDLGIFQNGRVKLLHGRKKDMIPRSDGSNLYPEDVEAILRQEGAPMQLFFADRRTAGRRYMRFCLRRKAWIRKL